MKKETIQKRLEKANVNKTTSAYKLLTNWLSKEGNDIIRTCWTSGRGRYTSNMDYTADFERLLTTLRVRYERGNDSPRGGLTGNYIKILL